MPINWNLLDRDAPMKAGMAPMQGYQGAVQNAMATQGQKQTLAQNQMALEQAQQGMDDKNRMRDIYSQGGDVQAGLQGAGFGQEAMQYGAQDTQNRVGLLQEKKLKIEDALTKFKVTGQIQSTVKDQESYDQARQQIAEILGPEAAARMPEVYNPEEIEANKQKAFTLQEQLFNQYKEVDAILRKQTLDANANKFGSPYTVVQDGVPMKQQVTQSGETRTLGEAPEQKGTTITLGNKGTLEAIKPLLQDMPKMQETAKGAAKNIARLDQALSLADKRGDDIAGWSGDIKRTFAKPAKAIGLDLDVMNDAEIFNSLLTEGQGALRLQVVGPGPVSEYEQKILEAVSGKKMSSIKGIKLILERSRDNQVADIDTYNEQIGSLGSVEGMDIIPQIYKKVEYARPRKDQKNVIVNTQEEYDALPSGAEYTDPDDGQLYRKP